jgi:hypothetical protein
MTLHKHASAQQFATAGIERVRRSPLTVRCPPCGAPLRATRPDMVVECVHLRLHGQRGSAWVGLLSIRILSVLPLLTASTFSAPTAQTMRPRS